MDEWIINVVCCIITFINRECSHTFGMTCSNELHKFIGHCRKPNTTQKHGIKRRPANTPGIKISSHLSIKTKILLVNFSRRLVLTLYYMYWRRLNIFKSMNKNNVWVPDITWCISFDFINFFHNKKLSIDCMHTPVFHMMAQTQWKQKRLFRWINYERAEV